MLYKAFISYSHGTDYVFAVALEAALQRFALPANGQPAIRLFRDASNLSATPELWPTIQQALKDAEFLLLIASEESAKSRWVNQEVEYWLAHGRPGHGARPYDREDPVGSRARRFRFCAKHGITAVNCGSISE